MSYDNSLVLENNVDFVTARSSLTDAPEGMLPTYASIEEMIKELKPIVPVRCVHPEALKRSAEEFLKGFPGEIYYAVKANPSAHVLRTLWAAGVRGFDVASYNEIKMVRRIAPEAKIAFMNTVKNRDVIRSAYFDYGVREFVTDSFEELYKILEATKTAADLTIHVRLAMPNDMALHPLSKKFGATKEEACDLLKDASKVAHKIGLTFHVGHLCVDPAQYSRAIEYAREVISSSGVELDVLDVGGGFSRSFPGIEAPPLSRYFRAIKEGIQSLNLPKTCEIRGEPGLAMAVDSETLVVRVELRKGDSLYINDGTFGGLFDAAKYTDGKRFPVQLVRLGRKCSATLQPFSFYGPTCDSMDEMPGPFLLPKDTREGDYIIISRQGAYCGVFQTSYNSMFEALEVEIIGQTQLSPVKRRVRRLPRQVQEVAEAQEQ